MGLAVSGEAARRMPGHGACLWSARSCPGFDFFSGGGRFASSATTGEACTSAGLAGRSVACFHPCAPEPAGLAHWGVMPRAAGALALYRVPRPATRGTRVAPFASKGTTMSTSVKRVLAAVALAFLSTGACERPQDRPLEPEIPKLEPPAPTDPGNPDADTGRTIGPLADVAGSFGQAGSTSPGGTLGSGGSGAGIPGTGGRHIH